MKTSVRLLLLLLIMVVQMLYFPVNRMADNGTVIKTALDDRIPLMPIWAVPYLIGLIWWVASYVWAALKMEAGLYKQFVFALTAVMMVSYIIYLLYPTYMVRPALEGQGWEMDLMRFIYGNDRVYNAFPSGHTYISFLILLFWWQWIPRRRPVWAVISLTVILSTLFTKQHHLPDLVGGMALAILGYWASKMMLKKKTADNNVGGARL